MSGEVWGGRTGVHPLHAIWEAVGSGTFVIVHSQRSGDDTRVCWPCGSVCVDVVSSPAGIHDDGVRSSEGRPAGDEADEFGETEHIGDSIPADAFKFFSVPFSYTVRGWTVRIRKVNSTKPAACGGGGHQHLRNLAATPRATTPDSTMRTPQANRAPQRVRIVCVRWLARQCMSSAVSAMVSRLARIGFKVAYWATRDIRPTSGGMRLGLPHLSRRGQRAHAGNQADAGSDSLSLCDGLAGFRQSSPCEAPWCTPHCRVKFRAETCIFLSSTGNGDESHRARLGM